jgi:hypothetical protein
MNWIEALDVIKARGLCRSMELIEIGLHHRELADMLAAKLVRRLAPGLYALAEADPSPEVIAVK